MGSENKLFFVLLKALSSEHDYVEQKTLRDTQDMTENTARAEESAAEILVHTPTHISNCW